MSPRKRVAKVQVQQSNKAIQYSALAVIIIVIAIFVFKFTSRKDALPQAACDYFESIAAASQYASPPALEIDLTRQYSATLTLEKGGVIEFQLFADKAPATVNNFLFLACKGFYNGVTFHRVLEDFMAQTGDPTGTGTGGPGYRFDDEISDLKFDKPGIVAMANSGPNTNGSQFFITFGPAENLNGNYTIFGLVNKGIEVVKSIALRDLQKNPAFEGDKIKSITVTQK